MSRTINSWGALCLAAVEGREDPSVVSKMLFEASGCKAPAETDADLGVTVKALATLAELLESPAELRRQIADLDRATLATKAAAEVAKVEQAKVAKAHEALDAARRAHDAALDKERAEHRAALDKDKAEIEAAKKETAATLARAKTDADATAKIRADLGRRLKIITEAA